MFLRCSFCRRTHLYVPLADPASAATGKRCAFLHDEHSRRRLVAILRDGDEPPGGGSGGGGGDGRQRSRDFVVAKLAAVLQVGPWPGLRLCCASAADVLARCTVCIAGVDHVVPLSTAVWVMELH
jgi:hypothetical protein